VISVIVPTYNRPEELLGRALPSVFAQTVQDQEVLVVGDGTDPVTMAGLADLARTHENLRFWNLPHFDYPEDQTTRWGLLGLAALNHGLDHARGDWIAVLADDDEFTPHHHEVLLKAAERSGADHVYGISQTYKNNRYTGQDYGRFPPGDGAFCNGANLYRASLGYRYDLNCWDRGLTGDADLWTRMYADGVKFHFEPRVVHKYHRHWP
jgi:glycosyltransferase involved in cell wall biosynthesis